MPIETFRHKGLCRLFEDDDPRKVPAELEDKLRKMLAALDAADAVEQTQALPGWRLHPLKGDRKGFWAMMVSGNLRLVFRFEDGNAFEVDLIDYH